MGPPHSPQHRAPPRPAVLPWLPGTLGDRALPLRLGPGLMSSSTSRRVTFDAARQRLCYNVRVFIRRSCRHVFHPSPLRHPQLCPCTLHTAGVNLGMGRDGTWRIGHTRPHDTKRNTASCQRRWGAPDALGTIGTERFCGVWGAPSHLLSALVRLLFFHCIRGALRTGSDYVISWKSAIVGGHRDLGHFIGQRLKPPSLPHCSPGGVPGSTTRECPVSVLTCILVQSEVQYGAPWAQRQRRKAPALPWAPVTHLPFLSVCVFGPFRGAPCGAGNASDDRSPCGSRPRCFPGGRPRTETAKRTFPVSWLFVLFGAVRKQC